MKIFVTGGTGFIGGHLVERLIQAGHEVICMVRQTSHTKSLESINPDQIISQDDVLNHRYDFRDIDVIYHLAAIRHRYGTSEAEYRASSVGLTKNLLDQVREYHPKFIFCSSIAVFGWPKQLPISDQNPYAPVSSYARSKVDCEKLVQDYHQKYEIPTTIVRPSITYGPRDTTGMMTKLITMIQNGSYRTVGSGQNRVQLAYISDIINGFMLVLNNEDAIGEGFIITAERPIAINELVELIGKQFNKTPPHLHVPLLPARIIAWGVETLHRMGFKLTGKNEPIITNEKIDVMTTDRAYDISKAKNILGYQPEIDYPQGIQKTIQSL